MKQSATLLAKQVKLDRIKKNLDVYDAGLGENPISAPKSMVDTVKKYSHLKEYSNSKGITELQSILGNKLIVGNGLKPLISILQLGFSKLYPDGVIIHSVPYWVSYKEQTNIYNLNSISLEHDDNWKLTPEILENNLKNINKQTLIIFNNPTNPSGCIYNKEEIKNLSIIFKKYNCIVFADDIYNLIVHPKYKNEFGLLSKYYQNTIVGSSLSKTFACGGYRLGWLKFPDKLDNLYNICNILASSIYSCPSIMLQHVAAKALTFPDDIKNQMSFQENMYQEISEYCKSKFKNMNILYSNSKAAWYFLIDFLANYKQKLNKINIKTSDDLNMFLAQNLGFITVSGSAFGIKKQLVVRYSYVDIKNINVEKKFNYDNIKKGLEVLNNWLTNM